MVAPGGAMSDSESCSNSSSDAEELDRCREAAMPAWGLEQRPQWAEKPRTGRGLSEGRGSSSGPWREVNKHEEDGNELQTTPEFRAFVAKKLGAMLDSSIAVSEVWKKPCKAEGSTEVRELKSHADKLTLEPESASALSPSSLAASTWSGGDKVAVSPVQLPANPAALLGSSDDSDEEWQRCREAAVSASDILQESAIHCPAEVKKEAEKKKLKKKAKKKADIDLTGATGLKQVKEPGSINGDPASLGTKKKKMKKKAKKAREASPCPPAECAAAGPEN
ncbi:Protein CUSTOS [Lemmus lemmus]